MCVSLQRRAIQNFEMYVLLQRRAQTCLKQVTDVHRSARNTKLIVLPQFRTCDQQEVTKELPVHVKNLRFTTVLDVRRARSDEKVARAPSKFAFNFTTVLSVPRSLFALRVARRSKKFACHHSFERPTITFRVKGCSAT